jgi:hypothetical protein
MKRIITFTNFLLEAKSDRLSENFEKWYDKNCDMIEDEEAEILKKDYLEYFKEVGDIWSYKSYEELRSSLNNVISNKGVKDENDFRNAKEGTDYLIAYEDTNWLIIDPITFKGNLKYIRGTKWCTSFEKYFNMYNEPKFSIVYAISKINTDKKYCLYKGKREDAISETETATIILHDEKDYYLGEYYVDSNRYKDKSEEHKDLIQIVLKYYQKKDI